MIDNKKIESTKEDVKEAKPIKTAEGSVKK
jgi:hypothetical protein